jgi:hypothetical protein
MAQLICDVISELKELILEAAPHFSAYHLNRKRIFNLNYFPVGFVQ